MREPTRNIAMGGLLAACLATLSSCAKEDGGGGVSGPLDTLAGATPGLSAGRCALPPSAPVVSKATARVVGNGTRASCTADAFRAAVAHGGSIVFDCGPDTMTIVLDKPAKVFNDSVPDIVIDGGGKITLSGGGKSRILYMNTCDKAQHWTTPHCQDQDHPRLVVQNLTFVDGDARNEPGEKSGGAIFASGGTFKVFDCRFFRNQCVMTGPDDGGGAIRAYNQSRRAPVEVVGSVFGDSLGNGNVGSNGGALSSIGVSWTIWNSRFVGNRAVGHGGNPAQQGTVGGGSGGAIYNDGDSLVLTLCGSRIEKNQVDAFGAAVFFVVDNHVGLVHVEDSRISGNLGGAWYELPGISMHSDTRREVVNSVVE